MYTLLRTALTTAMLSLFANGGMAQSVRTVVVADATTRQPVPHASLYAKDAGRFRSVVSGSNGQAPIGFTFRKLNVTHLNYEGRQLNSPLPDTIFLQPRYQPVGEVVVTNREPEWIRRKLKQVVKGKDSIYFATDDSLLMDYHTQSLGTNSLYRMRMTGWLRPRSKDHKRYALKSDTAIVTAPDSTRLTDTANLRRMLYEDFMADLDGHFIRSHRFRENTDAEGLEQDEVELRFRTKSQQEDRGWMVVDTARCIVTSAYRFTGTKANRQERIGTMMYSVARVFGYRVDTFTRDYRVSYGERPDGTLYPAEVRYKMYYAGRDGDSTKAEEEFSQQTGGGFPNMEATLELSPLRSTFGRLLPTGRKNVTCQGLAYTKSEAPELMPVSYDC